MTLPAGGVARTALVDVVVHDTGTTTFALGVIGVTR
jgi:hypothetical protein